MHVPSSNSPDHADLENLIQALANEQAIVREKAAAEIFRRGVALTSSVCSIWFKTPQFAKLFIGHKNGDPHMTVGVAVAGELFEKIRHANGIPPLANVPPDQDAVEFELEFRNEVRLDVLTAKDVTGNGAIARYLQKFGMGIQQVEFLVSDVDKATDVLRAEFGVDSIYPKTRDGANNTRVNFSLVTTPENTKVLVEFVEAAR